MEKRRVIIAEQIGTGDVRVLWDDKDEIYKIGFSDHYFYSFTEEQFLKILEEGRKLYGCGECRCTCNE